MTKNDILQLADTHSKSQHDNEREMAAKANRVSAEDDYVRANAKRRKPISLSEATAKLKAKRLQELRRKTNHD